MFPAKCKASAGDVAAAHSLAEEILQLAQELRDPRITRDAILALIEAVGDAGDVGRARALLDENLPLLVGCGAQYVDAVSRDTVLWLGYSFRGWGEYETARRLLEQQLAVCREEQDRWSVARIQVALAQLDRE